MVKHQYEELLKVESVKNLPHVEQIDIFGTLFDLSYDNENLNGIELAFKLSSEIDFEVLETKHKVYYHYLLGNGWGYKRKLSVQTNSQMWSFQSEELSKEIFHLRKAISIEGFDNVSNEIKCQVFCNLGNLFSHIGRFVEAQELWNRAIILNGEFAMAYANKGHSMLYYQNYLYDTIHKNLFLIYGYHHIRVGLSLKEHLHDGAEEYFTPYLISLEKTIPMEFRNKLPKLNKFKLGRDKKLKDYRRWCIDNCLYINPLNDLGRHTDASHDCLNMPSMVFEVNAPPIYFTLFNQMKQEFGTARFIYYESVKRNNPHFSDKDIVIVETPELAKYSYHLEQLKSAFRMSYSIMDKIAFFLNNYLNLGIAEYRTTFRNVFYEKPKERVLRSSFTSSNNWALRGLYWLSLDLHEKDEDFESVIEPEAKEIAKIRNAMEHKSFKIISEFLPYPEYYDKGKDIAYAIHRHELEIKTLKLLTLTRAAMMYLAFAINHEEEKKDNSKLNAIEIKNKEIPHGYKF